MENTKEQVRKLLNNLPDDCTIEDIQYHLYVMRKIEKGLKRAETEGTVEHSEVRKRFAKWLQG